MESDLHAHNQSTVWTPDDFNVFSFILVTVDTAVSHCSHQNYTWTGNRELWRKQLKYQSTQKCFILKFFKIATIHEKHFSTCLSLLHNVILPGYNGNVFSMYLQCTRYWDFKKRIAFDNVFQLLTGVCGKWWDLKWTCHFSQCQLNQLEKSVCCCAVLEEGEEDFYWWSVTAAKTEQKMKKLYERESFEEDTGWSTEGYSGATKPVPSCCYLLQKKCWCTHRQVNWLFWG